ncbi:hypothetical protein [Carboxylicivirga sp. N1Y90]|uniref:hypothetical protein n=1 Tax=Carboxylicivirga fragile TaxID=3417571 RepID=UPI003D33FE5A|nr:hypothetical protein [Marinilabiliaceae bacterium N1Y90]
MKNFLIVSIIILLTQAGCASYPSYDSFDTYIDFDRYSQANFFISINDYNGKFAPKGLLSVSCYSGEQKVEKTKAKDMFNDDIYYSSSSSYKKEFKACNVNELLDEIVSNARSKGADGLTNLKIVNTSRIVKKGNKKMKQPGILITGFAIDREE